MSNLRKHGDPPFVVAVVHGGPGARGEMAPVARELSQIVGVLEPLQTAATIQAQVEELRAILEDSASLPLTLIGFSWGAWLGCILAYFHPELINNLILVSSGPMDQKYASSVMKTRLRRLHGVDKKEAASLYHALGISASSDNNYCESLSRLSELISTADSIWTYAGLSGMKPADSEAAGAYLKLCSISNAPYLQSMATTTLTQPTGSNTHSHGPSGTSGSSCWRNVVTILGGKDTHETCSTAYLMLRSNSNEPLTTGELRNRPEGALHVTEACFVTSIRKFCQEDNLCLQTL